MENRPLVKFIPLRHYIQDLYDVFVHILTSEDINDEVFAFFTFFMPTVSLSIATR